MSLLWPLLAGLVLALALGGRLQRIADLRLRGLWLFYVALALQFAAFPLRWMPWHTPDHISTPLWLASYGVIGLAALLNVRLPGVPVMVAGMLSNVLAVTTNGGHMPALPSALRGAGLHFTVNRNSALADRPHLAWLVDRWAAPDWIPWANVYSVGDVIISVGAVIFALAATGVFDRLRPRRSGASGPVASTR